MKKTPTDILSAYNIDIKENKGRDYITLCPFHDDSNPSFSMDKNSGVYHCWSCHAKGNLITFVKNIEHISYEEAVSRVVGDEKLSSLVYFVNTTINQKEKEVSNYLDLKYYELKKLLLLFFDCSDISIMEDVLDVDDYIFLRKRQHNICSYESGKKFTYKKTQLKLTFDKIEYDDNLLSYSKDYEDTKYERLIHELYINEDKYYKELDIVMKILNSEKYNKLKYQHMQVVKKLYNIYGKYIKTV